MIKINIKPLSVNKCWQGKRFKTKEYKAYEEELLYLLPSNLKIPKTNIGIEINIGMSNNLSDIDNILKPFLDILQKKYKFNDREIIDLHIRKFKTEKQKEYIEFNIYKMII